MGNKLKAISKVSVALALLGAAVPAVEAAPTAMAAKKVTKKAKKSTKKVVKKSTKKAKKAKKATKKVAKKTAAKKPAKKSVKKTTKKVVKKPVAKKSVKKVAKKPVAKKPAKKAVKKPAKKSVKKPVAKKPAKKVVKKTTTKKPAKKFVKRVTMADKYQPKVKSSTVNVNWGTDLWVSEDDEDGSYPPEDFITNKSSLPSGVYFYYSDYVDTSKSGTYKTRIAALYDDGSREVVGTVTFVVLKSDAEKYPPTVKDVTINYGGNFDLRKDAITNALGYFPKNTKFSYDIYGYDEDGYDDDGYDDDGRYFTYKSGTYNAHLSVEYPDGSEDTKTFKITVLPSDADKAKLSLKSSNFTVLSNETLKHKTDDGNYTLNDPTRFLNIGSALPKGTLIQFDSVDSDFYPEHPAPGKYETSLCAYFPDGSVYRTDNFIVNVK